MVLPFSVCKIVVDYIRNLPEVKNNAYKYFNYDNRVVDERVDRGDPKIPYYTAKDISSGLLDDLVKYAGSIINDNLMRYHSDIAIEDALHTAIRSYRNGFYDGKINANCFNLLKNFVIDPIKITSKKKDEGMYLTPAILHQLGMKRKDVPRRNAPRKDEMILHRDRGKVRLRKRNKK